MHRRAWPSRQAHPRWGGYIRIVYGDWRGSSTSGCLDVEASRVPLYRFPRLYGGTRALCQLLRCKSSGAVNRGEFTGHRDNEHRFSM